MDILALTLHQSHPRTRRHTTSNLSSFFKSAMGGAFLSFFEDTLSRKPTLEQNEQEIKSNFKTINNIIDLVDQHIVKRLQIHEQEVFSIVKEQIEAMRKQTENIINELNLKIKEKDINNEMWHLSNELDYFKNVTFKLFQQNKQYRLQIKLLENSIANFKIQNQCLDATMQKLRKKYLRQKSLHTKRGQNKQKKLSHFNLTSLRLKDNHSRNQQELSMREVKDYGKVSQKKQQEELIGMNSVRKDRAVSESRVDINLENHSKLSPAIFAVDENHEKQRILDQLSIPSLSANASNTNSLPPVRLIKVESHEINDSGSLAEGSLSSQIHSSIIVPTREDKATQTEELFIRLKQSLIANSNHTRNNLSIISRSKRYNTEKNNDSSILDMKEVELKEGEGIKERDRQASVRRQRQALRVMGQGKKQPKSIMYMSNALGKSKLRMQHLVTTRQHHNNFC